jgi:hypothetical protein
MFVYYVADRPSLVTTLTSEGPVIVRLLLAMKKLQCKPQWLGTVDQNRKTDDCVRNSDVYGPFCNNHL